MSKPKRKIYINRYGQGQRETVSEADTQADADYQLTEYQLSDPSAIHYLSSRACKNWTETK